MQPPTRPLDAAVPVEAFPAVERPRAAEAVLRALIDAIRGGAVEIGGRLPRAENLAAHFGVSRLVVREALEYLRRAGVVQVRRGTGGGVFVASLQLPTELLTERPGLDRSEVRELLEARRAAEMTCAALATARVQPGDLKDLRRLVDALSQTTDSPGCFIELDVRFHLRLAAVSGNEVLTRLLGTVFRDLALVRERYPVAYGSMQAAIALQLETLESISAGDRDRVLAAMDTHLEALEQHFLGFALDYPGSRQARTPA